MCLGMGLISDAEEVKCGLEVSSRDMSEMGTRYRMKGGI